MKNTLGAMMYDGLVYAPAGRESGSERRSQPRSAESGDGDHFDMLMSLALDDMLTPDEMEEFESALDLDTELAKVWDQWQEFDKAFRSSERIQAPSDFVSGFESRLLKRERRRRVWLGIGVGLAAAALWLILVVALVGAGAYVMLSQAEWLAATVRMIVHYSVLVQSQIDSIMSTIAAAVATPQVQVMALAYTVFAAFSLWFWARFLRRTVDIDDVPLVGNP